jgi:hypothetical protein
MEHVGVVIENLAGSVSVVCVSVHDSESVGEASLPEPGDGERHVVEAAVASKVVEPRVVAAGSDGDEGVSKLPGGDALSRLNAAASGRP